MAGSGWQSMSYVPSLPLPPLSCGLGGPLSLSPPSPHDLQIDDHLKKAVGVFDTNEDKRQREAAIATVTEIGREWVRRVAERHGASERVRAAAAVQIFPFGSYALQVCGPGSDVDVVCVGPSYASREVDFFMYFYNILATREDVTDLISVPNAHVPLIKFTLNGIHFDLVYAKLATPFIQMAGFLGGINCAILAAKICTLYPKALPSTLLPRLFSMYSQWKWPTPIMLCPIDGSLKGTHTFQWDPRQDFRDRRHQMPIITPLFPCANSCHRVSKNSLAIMTQELLIASNKCQDGERKNWDNWNWNTLFEAFSFLDSYDYFIKLVIEATNKQHLISWKGFVMSRLCGYLIQQVESKSDYMIACHPDNSEYFYDFEYNGQE